MTAIPIVLFWTLALHGLFSRKPMLVYLFFATMPVGAFAVIPTSLTGGLTFTPTPVIALLLIARHRWARWRLCVVLPARALRRRA